MSLVNNMLRDLDQRRKDSEASSARVTLTPAQELPRSENNNAARLALPILVLLGIVAGLGYYWLQLDNEQAPQQLNIRPEVASEPSESSSIQSLEEPATTESSTINLVEATQFEDANIQASQDEAAQLESPSQAETLALNEPEATVSTQPNSVQREQSNSQATVSSTEPGTGEPVIAESEVNEESVVEAASPTSEVAIRDIRDQEPVESVKDSAALTPEEKDTTAVQVALRLIADNQTGAAYLHLEQHITENRYAHQSRETYAKLLLSQGDMRAAFNLAESGLNLAPNHSGFKKIKARVLIQDGQIDEAVSLLIARAPDVADDITYHDLLATAQFASRDYAGALISYTGLVQHDQSRGKWWYGFAASHDFLGNVRAARQGYTQAIQLSNLSASLRRRSQDRLTELGQ